MLYNNNTHNNNNNNSYDENGYYINNYHETLQARGRHLCDRCQPIHTAV